MGSGTGTGIKRVGNNIAKNLCSGSGQMVSVLVLYSNDPSLNPASLQFLVCTGNGLLIKIGVKDESRAKTKERNERMDGRTERKFKSTHAIAIAGVCALKFVRTEQELK